MRVALASSGTTARDRYHSAESPTYAPGVPLVLQLRGADSDPQDLVRITKAELVGKIITLGVETRHLTGPFTCTKCPVPSAPLVEIQLGALAAGDYRVVIEHADLEYDDQNQPERTSKGRAWKDGWSFRVAPPPAPAPRMP